MVKKKVAQVEELEAKMIRHVRHGGATSRLELAQAFRLAPSTTGIYVDRLIEGGFLVERSAGRALRRGRPAQVLSINGSVGYVLGVEVTSKDCIGVSVDFSGNVIERARLCVDDVVSIQQLIDCVGALIEKVKPPLPLLGIGISIPMGERYSFIYALEEAFSVPVVVGDWAKAAALWSLMFGRGVDYHSFACIVVSDSVGVGKVINGALYQCQSCEANIGKIKLGLSETYGETADDVISAPAILRYVNTQLAAGRESVLPPDADLPAVIQAAGNGDVLAQEALKRAMRGVGWLAHLLVLIINPEVIFLSGVLNSLGDWLRVEVEAALKEFSPAGRAPEVILCACTEEKRGLGAAAMALDGWKPNRKLEGGAL